MLSPLMPENCRISAFRSTCIKKPQSLHKSAAMSLFRTPGLSWTTIKYAIFIFQSSSSEVKYLLHADWSSCDKKGAPDKQPHPPVPLIPPSIAAHGFERSRRAFAACRRDVRAAPLRRPAAARHRGEGTGRDMPPTTFKLRPSTYIFD